VRNRIWRPPLKVLMVRSALEVSDNKEGNAM
jgi:hypothetical protein